MPRKRSPTLTDGEARLMNVLWERKSATVADVVAALPRKPPVAYNTVQTLLRILEDKGYVEHEKIGRAFSYRPLIDRQDARRSAIGHLVARLFNDSPRLLLLNLLEDERIDGTELRQFKRLIEEA
jgi:predicted transcriptional regulator